jgi:tetratricopeptide (TPR) repeat protein
MSGSVLKFFGLCCLVSVAVGSTGCSQVRGRRKIQQGNQLYRDGQYKDAVVKFEEAEKFVPEFWVLWLNKGYTCRQMIIPGSKTPETMAAATCALNSFKKLQEIKPEDPRGELLYIQTLFDADKFEELAKLYEDRYQKNPREVDNITGLIQVYSKWQKFDQALEWYTKKAEVQANDAEAQYAVGVYIWQHLMAHGGGQDKASHDPRPDPNKKKDIKIHPPFGMGDVVGQQRIDLADKGIQYLQKALALRPKYFESMVYVNLLYRQRSFALFEQPAEWQKAVDSAKEWMCKSLEVQGKHAKICEKTGGGAAASEDDKVGQETGGEEVVAKTAGAAPATPEPAAKPEKPTKGKKKAVKKKPGRRAKKGKK